MTFNALRDVSGVRDSLAGDEGDLWIDGGTEPLILNGPDGHGVFVRTAELCHIALTLAGRQIPAGGAES
jgi:hypothetical protein